MTQTFDRVASEFSAVRDYAWDLLAPGIGGDVAYTVAIESYAASLREEPPAQQELRVTHVYGREHGHGSRSTATPTGSHPPHRAPRDREKRRR